MLPSARHSSLSFFPTENWAEGMRKTKCACLQPRGDGIYTIDPRWKGDADKGADKLAWAAAHSPNQNTRSAATTLRVHPSFVKLWNEFSFFDAKVTFFSVSYTHLTLPTNDLV